MKMKNVTLFILFSLSLFSVNLSAASFDCNKAKSFAEKTICSNPGLSKQDDDLKIVYDHAKNVVKGKELFSKVTRQLWKDRERCNNYECVSDWYNDAFIIYEEIVKRNSQNNTLSDVVKKNNDFYYKNYECHDSRDGNLALVTDYGNRFVIFTRRAERFESGIISLQPNGSLGGISNDASEYYLVDPGNNYTIQYTGYSINALGCRPRKN